MLARALRKKHLVQVLSFRKQFPSWLYPGTSDIDPSEDQIQCEAERILDPLNPQTWWKASKMINAWKPDQVIFQWWTTFWAPAYINLSFLIKGLSAPITFIVHNVLPHEKHLLDTELAKITLKHGDQFITHSPKEKDKLLSIFQNANVICIPHPWYDYFLKFRIPNEEARSKLNLPIDAPIFLFFGIVREYKGLGHLIEAFARLLKQGSLAYLIVAGEFWENFTLYQEQVSRLKISDNVIFENRYIPNEEVALYFSAANALVIPYERGTQSGVATIGLAFDIPIITSEHIALGISPDRNEKIKVVQPGDVEALTNAMGFYVAKTEPSSTGITDQTTHGWDELVNCIEGFV